MGICLGSERVLGCRNAWVRARRRGWMTVFIKELIRMIVEFDSSIRLNFVYVLTEFEFYVICMYSYLSFMGLTNDKRVCIPIKNNLSAMFPQRHFLVE